jgi:hypothetical protein
MRLRAGNGLGNSHKNKIPFARKYHGNKRGI